jgi:hypothetical protein
MLALTTSPGVPGAPATNGPQSWNFSQSKQGNEVILRTDIISPSSGLDGGSFPSAGWAEQDTIEPSDENAWRYYSLTNQGRFYYGFAVDTDVDASSLVVFNSSTLDITNTVRYLQTWNRTVTWHGVADGLPVSYNFTASATVDAFGTLALPTIGPVPALRVHEVHNYQATYPGFGLVDSHQNQYYYWLVPRLGVAVQITLFGDNTVFPLGLTETNAVMRMFADNYFTNSPATNMTTTSSGNLHIQLHSGAAVLNWDVFTNATSYRVDMANSLPPTNWQSLGSTTNRSWTNTGITTQRFFRVVGTH